MGAAAALHAEDMAFTQYREPGILMWRDFGLQVRCVNAVVNTFRGAGDKPGVVVPGVLNLRFKCFLGFAAFSSSLRICVSFYI